jgi:threonine dehydrogenase-like Zn-dependent dehydrogenase
MDLAPLSTGPFSFAGHAKIGKVITSESLPSTIRAAVLEAPGRIVVKDIPMWPLTSYGDPDLVLVKVAACGVCGSDFRYFAGENPWAQHTLGRFVPNPANIVLGHEFAGEVVAVLSSHNEHLLGKQVAPICSKVCGACFECRAGRTRLCPNTVHLGHGQGWGERDYYPGAYSEYVPAWGASCFEVPSTRIDDAALLDILAVAVHVTETGCVQSGKAVLCLGAGPAGNAIGQAALAMGARRVIYIDRSPFTIDLLEKQGIAEALGTRPLSDDIDYSLANTGPYEVLPGKSLGIALDMTTTTTEEFIDALAKLEPDGFGSVFDSIGTSNSVKLGVSVLAKAGTFVNLAVHDEPMAFNFLDLSGERKITTSCNFEVGDYPKALAWLQSGKFRVQDWIAPIVLDDLPGAFERELSGEADHAFKLMVYN